MKQQARERFENMRCVLKHDEQAVIDSLELDLKRTRTKLDQVLRDWKKHQDQVTKSISSIQRALSKSPATEHDAKVRFNSCALTLFKHPVTVQAFNHYLCLSLPKGPICESEVKHCTIRGKVFSSVSQLCFVIIYVITLPALRSPRPLRRKSDWMRRDLKSSLKVYPPSANY